MTGILFLAIRVLASPTVNLFQKRLTQSGVSPVFVVLVAYIFFSSIAIPYLAFTNSSGFPREFWYYMVPLAIVDAFGNMFLVRSIKTVDLSVFGPLNAYKPVVALLLSVFIIHEIPTMAGVAGVLIIIAGSYVLHLSGKAEHGSIRNFMRSEGIILRFLSIIMTSFAAVLSKKTILMSSPLITLSYWSVIGMPLVLVLYLAGKKFNKRNRPVVNVPLKYYAGLLISFLFLQVFSLYTFKYVLIGYSLALFQLSAVISVFLGSRFFGEGNIRMRYLAALIMMAGAAFIVLFG
jgi:drug/metabolite transporter (DMT)-like permease